MRASRQERTVGLDKPCRVCGKPVHYTYASQTGGVCGRCADKRRPKGGRAYHRGMVLERGGPRRPRSPAAVVVRICIVLVVGAAAVMVALRYLLG